MPSGLRIGSMASQIDEALLARFRKLPAAIISDAMARLSAGGASLRPLGCAAICGTALTVKTAPGDNLFPHKALDMARAGDVIIIDAGGDLTNAIVGERMIRLAEKIALAGIVINGAVRDLAELRQSGVPVFAAGVTHRGPYKNGPGEINFPIAIDGMVVCPGDLIVGDEDGLICVPRDDAYEVCLEAERRDQQEKQIDPCEESRDWIDQKLKALGCEFPGSLDQMAAE
jgi:regulator of RNase E activity RraA